MIVRRAARPMLASVFIAQGVDTLRNPQPRAALAEPVAGVIAEAAENSDLPVNAWDTETYVKVNAAVHVGAGALLAMGRAPRLAATVLAASLVPTTLAGHRFWEAEGVERGRQRTAFLKNVGLFGGLVLAAVDTEGRPGLTWRARNARRRAADNAPTIEIDTSGALELAQATGSQATEIARSTSESAKGLAQSASLHAADLFHTVADHAPAVAQAVRERAVEASHTVADQAPAVAQAVRERAVEAGQLVAERAPVTAANVSDRARLGAQVLAERGPELAQVAKDRSAAAGDLLSRR